MPVSTRTLREYFGETYSELIRDVNEYLTPLGMQIFKFGDDYLLQFDVTELNRSEKGKLLYLLICGSLGSSKTEEVTWEYSDLSDDEKAVLMAALACARKFQSDTFSIDSLQEILIPDENTSLMTKGQFQSIISSLKRKQYLKRGSVPITLSIDWRLHAELMILKESSTDEVTEHLDNIDDIFS